MPTSCIPLAEGLPWSAHVDSWLEPGATEPGGVPDLSDPAWKSRTIATHQPPGYPLSLEPSLFPTGYSGPTEWGPAVGTEGCENEPFEPAVSAQPTTPAADSPSGLHFEIHMPQNGLTNAAPGAIAESDLKAVTVKLPEGMSVNPSAANGHLACSAAQIGLRVRSARPRRFYGAPQELPRSLQGRHGRDRNAAGLRTRRIEGVHPLEGTSTSPPRAITPSAPSSPSTWSSKTPSRAILKLPGGVRADPNTGQLETVFEDNPQLPFDASTSNSSAARAPPLRTPPACGTYRPAATLTPWSGNAAAVAKRLRSDQLRPRRRLRPPGRLRTPALDAGTANPARRRFSPFNLRLSREDGSQELGGLTVTLPRGLLGQLAGIPYCPDAALAAISGAEGTGRAAEQASPSCPAASQVGTRHGRRRRRPRPLLHPDRPRLPRRPLQGRPALPGGRHPGRRRPLRPRHRRGPRRPAASTPKRPRSPPSPTRCPRSSHGIPLDLRDVARRAQPPRFTLNPTSCDPMAVGAHAQLGRGRERDLSDRFQVGGCEAPRPSSRSSPSRLKGKTNARAHPALQRDPDACRPGAAPTSPAPRSPCRSPSSSTTPTSAPLHPGPVRRRRLPGGLGLRPRHGDQPAARQPLDRPRLPALLRPQAARPGRRPERPDPTSTARRQVDTGHGGGIRNTFEVVPDAPVTKFALR